MKTALLGGSFDPVHLGHLFLLHVAINQTDYRRFVIMPAKQSNFKRASAPGATDEQRLEMLRLALADFRDLYPQDIGKGVAVEVSDMEIKRGGISYTVDTVNELIKQGSDSPVGLIIGDDHLAKLDKWYSFDELRMKTEFLICRRYSENPAIPDRILRTGIMYRMLEAERTAPESSTEIRKNPEEHLDYLSERVRAYVREHKLYV